MPQVYQNHHYDLLSFHTVCWILHNWQSFIHLIVCRAALSMCIARCSSQSLPAAPLLTLFYSLSEVATRVCLENGTWLDPKGQKEEGWTNYSRCLPDQVHKDPPDGSQRVVELMEVWISFVTHCKTKLVIY